jgi:hypothetical protein
MLTLRRAGLPGGGYWQAVPVNWALPRLGLMSSGRVGGEGAAP